MTESEDNRQGALGIDRPGDKLRLAREAKGMSLQELATKTRVPTRQLESLEKNDFAALPGVPYAIGFSRAYARTVGLDEVEIAAEVRRELAQSDMMSANRYEMFEPADPARIPPRMLAWTAATIALLLAVGYGVWRTQMFTAADVGTVQPQAPDTQQAATPSARVAPATATDGPVVLTANDAVWLRIYNDAGDRLFERELAKGESYTVPANARNPMILTGRPDALTVTVGGKPVAPLGPPEKTIADVPISAAALLARPVAAETQTSNGSGSGQGSAPATAPVTKRAARPASDTPAPERQSAPAPVTSTASPEPGASGPDEN